MKDKLKDLLFLKALLASNKELVEMKNKVRKQFGESTIELVKVLVDLGNTYSLKDNREKLQA